MNVRLLVALFALCVACDSSRTHAARTANDVRGLLTLADTGLALALAVRDSVVNGDSVVVGVFLHNGGPPLVVRNYPSYYSFTVFDSGGGEVRPTVKNYEAPLLGTQADVLLPRGGVLGQVLSLRCAVPPYDPDTPRDGCMWSYQLEEGSYRMVVRYRIPQVAGEPSIPANQVDLISDTLAFRIGPDRD